MPTWNDILIRDSLQDNGTTPSLGYPYTSPDIICTQQTTYQDPTQQFSGSSYTTDPNQPVVNQQNNNFYVRGKNMGTTKQTGNMGTVQIWVPLRYRNSPPPIPNAFN